MRVVDEVGGKAVKVEIFRRAWTAKSIGQIHFQSADTANALDPGKLQFPVTQRLRVSLAIRNVAKRHPDAIAKRKGPYLVIAIQAHRRIALEFLPRALLHDTAKTPVEFRPLNFGAGVPKQSAHNLGARHTEDRFRRVVKGSQTPVTINSKETLAHSPEERLNKRFLVSSRSDLEILRASNCGATLFADQLAPILYAHSHRIIS